MKHEFVKDWTEPPAETPPAETDAYFPPVDDAAELVENPPEMPPPVIHGVLHKGWKMILGGGSKSYKTWSLIDLAVAVASGGNWWEFPTTKGKVLYCNFENQRSGFAARLRYVCRARGVKLEKGMLQAWNLRGRTGNREKLIAAIIQQARTNAYTLIVVDPFYKLNAGGDENDAGAISAALEPLDKIVEQTGAALAFGHHYSKGNQAGKDAIDRMSGSGVFARDPDAILTLTRHEEEGAFTVDAILRECPPVESFVVRWEFPRMHRDAQLDPAKLKQANGRAPKCSDSELWDILNEGEPLTMGEWEKVACSRLKIAPRTFAYKAKALKSQGRVKESPLEKGKWNAVQLQ